MLHTFSLVFSTIQSSVVIGCNLNAFSISPISVIDGSVKSTQMIWLVLSVYSTSGIFYNLLPLILNLMAIMLWELMLPPLLCCSADKVHYVLPPSVSSVWHWSLYAMWVHYAIDGLIIRVSLESTSSPVFPRTRLSNAVSYTRSVG